MSIVSESAQLGHPSQVRLLPRITWGPDVISISAIAVEDFKAADLDGDGKPDLIVAGRQTKNLVILWNAR